MNAPQVTRLATALRECEEMIDSGVPADWEFILTRYPDIAADLAACLHGLKLLRESSTHVDQRMGKATASGAASAKPVFHE